MALNKIARAMALSQMGAEKLLPPEIVAMARSMAGRGNKGAQGSRIKNPAGQKEFARLQSKTKGRDFDAGGVGVHKKSPLDYIPPAER